MPTAIQRRRVGFPALFLARDLTLGQSPTSGQMMHRIQDAYKHVMVLNQGTFEVGSTYLPLAPKRSYEVRPRYRFSGRLASLPFRFDD